MNKHIYKHIKNNSSRLSKQQGRVYIELKNLWINSRNKFCLSDETANKLQELEHLNNSLNGQIEALEDRLLRFELFGDCTTA